MNRLAQGLSIAATAFFLTASAAYAADTAAALKALDTDDDGTIDLKGRPEASQADLSVRLQDL